MPASVDSVVVVPGGSGNAGSYIVRALLERGATVVVPSRSQARLDEWLGYLADHLDAAALDRLHTFVADVGDEAEAAHLSERITEAVGPPDAVVATLGGFVPAPSVLEAKLEDLRRVLDSELIAHFLVARTFLPDPKERGGTYVMICGPLAFNPWVGSGGSLVGIATAAQHMMFRWLAEELEDSEARVVELVIGSFIRDRQTQPQSRLPAEAVGAYVAHLVSGNAQHGETIHLESLQQLEAIGESL